MRRLLLIIVAQMTLIMAIPDQDLKLIKQVESIAELAYKNITQEALEIYTYKAQLAIECKAVDEIESGRWQQILDFRFENQNLTDRDIQFFVDELEDNKLSYYNQVPANELEQRLNQCTNGTYGDKHTKSSQRSEEYLKTFENTARSNFLNVSNATKQQDHKMFEAFILYTQADKKNRETAFKNFRNKIFKYEDRVIITEVRKLEAQLSEPYRNASRKALSTAVESILMCGIVEPSKIEKIKKFVDHIHNRNLTSYDIQRYSTRIFRYLTHDQNKETFLKQIDECSKGLYQQLESNIKHLRLEYIKAFKNAIIPRMQLVSEASRHFHARLLTAFNEILHPDEKLFDYYLDHFVQLLYIF